MAGGAEDAESLLVRVCSWNVGETNPETANPELLREWLLGKERSPNHANIDRRLNKPDVIAIGLQEVDMTCYACWVGCCCCCSSQTGNGEAWKSTLENVLVGYSMIEQQQLMGMHLTIWWSTDFATTREISKEVLTNASGFFGIFGNKGGIVTRFRIQRRSMSERSVALCFVNCHYAAKQKKIAKRNADHNQILDKTFFKNHPHTILDHDYVFWFGDMNYRLQGIDDDDLELLKSDDNIDADDKDGIMQKYDQLYAQMIDEKVRLFTFFTEAKITWGPTYKLLKNRGGEYDLKRAPSYCDRILFYNYVHHKTRERQKKTWGTDRSLHTLPLLSDDDVEMSAPIDDDVEESGNPLMPESPAGSPSSPHRRGPRRPVPHLHQWKQTLGEDVPPMSGPITCLEYSTCVDPGPSDHRPVYGLFLLPNYVQGVPS